jgi:pSer/pThr/pTyr-binding forkhead associated (FHA) protein
MSAVLVVTEGPAAGQRFELDAEVVLGREGVSATIADDSELSRRHAVVRPAAGGFEIEDLGSRNGTFVNGQKVEGPMRLSGGDSIKIGQTVLALEGVARAAETAVSPRPAAVAAAAAAPSTAAPSEPFGALAAPAAVHRRGIASRQLGPMLVAWAIVIGDAIALAIYFSYHNSF